MDELVVHVGRFGAWDDVVEGAASDVAGGSSGKRNEKRHPPVRAAGDLVSASAARRPRTQRRQESGMRLTSN